MIMAEIDNWGKELSVRLECPIRYTFEYNLFVCKCGVSFPSALVRQKKWSIIQAKHNGGYT